MPTARAIQIRILDPKIQAYIQRHPFAEGSDPAMNVIARQSILAGLCLRPSAPDYIPTRITNWKTALPDQEDVRLEELFSELHIGADRAKNYRDDFAWEANLIPRTKKSVLVIGCGDGVELIFLRALLPEARFTALDYVNSLLPGIEGNIGLRFIGGDFNMQLRSLTREYDLIFSNHTLEHLYAPDEVLTLLVSLLVPGGHLVSVLPMTGKEGTPFLEKAHAATLNRNVNPFEMVFLDGGHPWKTNPSDLKNTLERAGLKDVQLYQRNDHVSRLVHLSPGNYARLRGLHIAFNKIFLTPLHALMKLFFAAGATFATPKVLFAIERRLFFGTNTVMSRFSEEALVIGESPA